jgi:hypothetical protein
MGPVSAVGSLDGVMWSLVLRSRTRAMRALVDLYLVSEWWLRRCCRSQVCRVTSVGVPYDASDIDLFHDAPLEESWSENRSVLCQLASSPASPGSLRGGKR